MPINGFIDDIDKVEKENSKRIENKELEDEHIRWYEEHLALLNEEFSSRAGITITKVKEEGEKEQQPEIIDDEEVTKAISGSDEVFSEFEGTNLDAKKI